MKLDIIVVEDEQEIANLLFDILTDANFSPRLARNSTEAFDEINKKVPNLMILDIWLRNSALDGLGILERVKAFYKLLPVIMISGHGTISSAVHAIKMGAYDYITKPFSQEKLVITIKRAYESAQLKKENVTLKNKFYCFNRIIGETSAIDKLHVSIEKAAKNLCHTVICGAPGVEKDTVANLVHLSSDRSNRPMLSLSLADSDKSRIEREFFGNKSTKVDDKKSVISKVPTSLLEQGNGGVIYISDLTKLQLATQRRLFDILISSKLPDSNKKLDVVLIVSLPDTIIRKRELDERSNIFVPLYNKLSISKIFVPSVSERLEDLELICNHFIHQLSLEHNI